MWLKPEALCDDFKQAEYTSLPVTLLILLFAFGALVAAGIPLLLGLTASLAANLSRSARLASGSAKLQIFFSAP